MNLIPRHRLGAVCCALSFPAFFFIQFLISDASPIFPGLPVKSQIAAVTDTCAPVIECINGLAGELLPLEPNSDPDGDGDIDSGAFTVLAADFIESGVSNCGGALHYSVYRLHEIEFGQVVPQTSDPDNITFTCGDCGTVNVRIYAWDDQFNPEAIQPDGTLGGPNYSFCETYILIQDNYSSCDCGWGQTIYGVIKTTENEAVKDVSVQLSGNLNNEDLTNYQGIYEFYPISYPFGPNNSHTVTPSLNTNHKNGLSQFDAILIRRHILGMELLNSPYKRIAADVNNNQKITIADVIQIQRLILGVDTAFAHNTSWRFVRADYAFPVPTNPWFDVFPESKTFNTFWSDNDQDFIAIKIGDVNSSAATSLLIPGTETPYPRDLLPERTIQPFLQPAPEYGALIKSLTDTCAPSIQCLQGLTFEAEPTEPGGSGGDIIAILQGADLVADASSTCSNSLQFSVYRSDDVVSGNVVPGPNQDSVVLNCAQDCQGTIILRVYVWDDNFNPDAVQPDGTVGGPNYAWCETYVLITDAQFCDCSGSLITISGYVKTESGAGVNNVSVSLTGSASETTSTDASGYYEFNNLTPGGNYTISPEKDVFPLNGVSVADVILLSKHILGLQPLGSPYKMIAGDVNNDKKLTTIDLIHLRKLILAIDTAFVANTSWRFVWADYTFPVPTNPWFEPFIEGGGSDFEEDTQIDFVAIKIGDVNGSAETTPFAPETESPDPRGAAPKRIIQPYLQPVPEYGAEIGMAPDTIAPIVGVVATEEHEPLANVQAIWSNSEGDTLFAGPYGSPLFNSIDLDPDETYTVTPHLDYLDLNGVSPVDFILIFRHILGQQPLGSAYKRIAADLNGDNQITNLDLIQYRRLILGLDNELTNNTSWRFILSDYVFPDPTNPWFEVFPESKTFTGTSTVYWPDFIAIKVGDVNSSANVD